MVDTQFKVGIYLISVFHANQQEARTRLNLHIEKNNLQSSLTGAELKEILEIICPISNQKLVVQLVDESLLCVKSEQLNITRMSCKYIYLIFVVLF